MSITEKFTNEAQVTPAPDDYKPYSRCLLTMSYIEILYQWPFLLTWFNFNPSMDK